MFTFTWVQEKCMPEVIHTASLLKKDPEYLFFCETTALLSRRFGHLVFGNPSMCTLGPLTTQHLKANKVKKRFIVNG